MSIRERLEDAILLWTHGRKHGAWIQVLIATAATSRRRFPNKRDGEAFKAFVREVTPTINDVNVSAIPGGVTVIFNADGQNKVALHDVMYKHLRCTLIHEGAMPTEVVFSEAREENGQLIGQIRCGDPLMIPDFWVLNLAKAVADAPENAVSCAGLFK
jgi:hypothetical protein